MFGPTIEEADDELTDETIRAVLRNARFTDPDDDRVTNQGDGGHVTLDDEFRIGPFWNTTLFNGEVTDARIDESPDDAPDDPEIHVTVERTISLINAAVDGEVTITFTVVADPETHELRRAYASRVLVPETQRALA